MAVSVVMLGASGAVGGQALTQALALPDVAQITSLGRRVLPLSNPKLHQEVVDVFDPTSYAAHLAGHRAAICTFGVGEPSKVSREEFLHVDKTAVLEFASACKAAGVQHFSLLSSVGVSSRSRSYFLRSKGELEDGLRWLEFERLSLFHPSIILTPTNRYGLSQGIILKVWPLLTPVLQGGLRKFRGVEVAKLGAAMARNVVRAGDGEEVLEWDGIMGLAGRK
ncbi:NAD(P)H-binding protein [Pseudorhodobacter ferrugineus]|uniref:NAD(P)H-binding protein n=1 Tax=Pseudorhodobacter ferrugineus TaxID=77008 RepID=UPI0003B74487|nr:NAD(P)H-binding protein [Pseudorhodobacter ferrugineus]